MAHRIDTSTAQKDKFGVGKNGFTRGNPQTGVPATELDDDYFDMLQEEIIGIVEAAGDTLDKTKRNQLNTALGKLFQNKTGATSALGALVPAANRLPYFTGANGASLTDLTSVGRDILASATKTAVLEYLGLGDLPKSFGTAAGKDVGTGDDELQTTVQADDRYKLKHWSYSAGSVLVTDTPLIINHGLTINPDLCVLNIKYRCRDANNGYSVGDYCIGFGPRVTAGNTQAAAGSLGALLTDTYCQFNVGNSGMYITPKNSGAGVGLNSPAALSQWALEFHIIYQ